MIILVILNTDMPFEIFPGNVGDDSALATALIRLSRGEKQTDLPPGQAQEYKNRNYSAHHRDTEYTEVFKKTVRNWERAAFFLFGKVPFSMCLNRYPKSLCPLCLCGELILRIGGWKFFR
jgi:hypothetical protein